MTIYDEIGGADAVAAAVDNFYDRVLADPELTHFFSDVDLKKLYGHQRAFIGAALGGPASYSGRGMRQAHARLDIRPAHFDAVVGHLVATLTELGVPGPTIEAIGATLAPLKSEIVSELSA